MRAFGTRVQRRETAVSATGVRWCAARRSRAAGAAFDFVESDGAGHRDVQGLGVPGQRDRCGGVAAFGYIGRESRPFGAEDKGGLLPVQLVERDAAVRGECDPGSRRVVEAACRDSKDCSGGRAQRARVRDVGAAA